MSITVHEERPIPIWYFRHKSGRYYNSQLLTALTTVALVADTLYGVPLYVPEVETTYTVIGLEMTSATAGNIRLGIYNDADGEPTSLVLDAGVVALGGVAGFKSIAISQALNPGHYWLAVVSDAAPTVRAGTAGSALPWLGYTSGTDVTTHAGVSVAFVYAALPDPFQAGFALSTVNVPRIMVSP